METIWWTGLCGNRSQYDAFWSPALSLNTSNPDLTLCMQRSLMLWIPAGWLWVTAPFAILKYRQAPVHLDTFSFSKLNLSKVVLGICMVIMSIISLGLEINTLVKDHHDPPVNILFYVIRLLTMALVTTLMRMEFLRGCHSSTVLCLFWLFYTIADVLRFRSRIMRGIDPTMEGEDQFFYGLELVLSIIVMVEFLLSIFADTAAIDGIMGDGDEEKIPLLKEKRPASEKKSDNPVPELRAGFWMKSFYLWIFPAMVRGYRKPVQFEELYDVRPEDACEKTVPIYYKKFKETAKYDECGRITNIRWAFYRALFETSGWHLLFCQTYKFISTGLFLLNPQLLRMMLTFMESGDTHTWKAILLAFGIFVTSWVGSIVRHNFFYVGWNAGLKSRSVVNAIVCRKALRLGGTAGKMTTVGEMVNHLSVDAQKIQDMFTFGQFLVELPIQVIFTIVLLWSVVGWSTISGLVFFGLAILINGAYIGKQITQCQLEQMVYKDRRLKIINEILNGIKILKLYAWEPSFHKQVSEERVNEVNYINRINMMGALSTATWSVTPYIISLAIFSLYTLVSDDHVLTADIAFVAISYINTLQFSLAFVPVGIAAMSQGIVSGNRIAEFLSLEEMDENSVKRGNDFSGNSIDISNGNFAWGSGEREILKNINLCIKQGELVAVVGNVGSGKSSLLSAMLGELVKKLGEVRINGNVAYVPQQAWIRNATVQDNILFGKPYDKVKYRHTLDACSLSHDLEVLPGGDQTEIGEKGINLSGGQKQRVSLARAVYQNEDIYLLDDPLSAVDAHVGKHIFDRVIGKKGILKDKTRILVTHAITFLPYVDKIVVLMDGRISEVGEYDDLIANNGDFAEFLRMYLIEQEVDEDSAPEIWQLHQRLSACSADDSQMKSHELSRNDGEASRRRTKTKIINNDHSTSQVATNTNINITPQRNTQLIEAETSEEGRLKFSIIWTFIKAGGISRFITIILAQISLVTAAVCTNIWLSMWTVAVPVNGSIPYDEATVWVGVYGGLGLIQVVTSFIIMGSAAYGCTQASKKLHGTLLYRILRAPMAFFDTTPLGRIMNRFSKDMDILDDSTPRYLRNWLLAITPLLSSLLIIIYSTPIFIVILVIIIIPLGLTQRVYITFASQLKRIDSVRRSPIYAHFDETVNGASSIRAYRRQEEFIDKADFLIDGSQRPYFMMSAVQRWLGITLETFAAFVCFFAALFAALYKDEIGPGLAGAAISYAFQVTVSVNVIVRSSTELETYMVCIERIDEYTKIQSEAELSLPGDDNRSLRNWPEEGTVSFKNYGTRYRKDLDLVLKGINMDIKSRSKVGVVGRTGAGKSSLTLALFRIIEAAQGCILIDGQDISKLGLHKLRSKLTVIPQDPVMFAGSLRENLDPFNEYNDDALWTALQRAHLKPFVQSLDEGLDYICGEGGDALSVGQRQLVCLARALLRQTKLLVLDEATAAVDMETDALIQESIRKHFSDCTVITVAHRLVTVMDYDMILVLDQGRIKEYDTPSNLLSNKSSTFYSLTKEAGLTQ